MNTLILLAAGESQRAGQNKLWAELEGQPLWTLAYQSFQSHSEIHEIILVVPVGEREKFQAFVDEKTRLVEGGSTRMSSFLKGLSAIDLERTQVVLDHNAASPHVSSKEITAVIEAAKAHGAAALSQPSINTLIKAENGFYTQVIPRESIRQMQTPQAVLAKHLSEIQWEEASDLTSALLKKIPVKVVEASPLNRKITFKEELEAMSPRVFFGEDSHAFSKRGVLKLAGLSLPDHPALEANSDGDVILHALGRALAQAQGKHFSDIADPLCEAGEKDSAIYLKDLLKGVHLKHLSVNIEALRPRMDALPIQENLSKILGMPKNKIQVSAMSGEGLTPFGQGQGIRCTVLIQCL